MKLYYDSEEEFYEDYDESNFQQPVYSDAEKRKRHNATIAGAMRAKWASSMMLTCPHPGVKDKYGTDRVCVWLCLSCSNAHRYPWHGGVSCDYGKN